MFLNTIPSSTSMPNQERSNVFRFTGIVFTEILRYSRSKNIENIGITEINAIIKKCFACAMLTEER